MRILQIIDSLEAGGAERMAVNYANALSNKISFSGLVVTRKEGSLIYQIDKNLPYLFLNKKKKIDFRAIYNLRKFVINNKVDVIHAHSTSYFIAFLLKLICPKIKIIWHDHYGNSEFLDKRPKLHLQICSFLFDGIIAVNDKLKVWSEQKLKIKNVLYLANFPLEENILTNQTKLKGIAGKRIVCLANLRIQKNHFLLLEVAKSLKQTHPDWTFHLVGKDFEDNYSVKIKSLVLENNLENTIHFYGSKKDIKNILNQAEICVLTSQSEGLPLALLEYGLNKKPVIATKVGEISTVIKHLENGFLVESKNSNLFYAALVKLIENESLRNDFGTALQKTIKNSYSEQAVLEQYIKWISKI